MAQNSVTAMTWPLAQRRITQLARYSRLYSMNTTGRHNDRANDSGMHSACYPIERLIRRFSVKIGFDVHAQRMFSRLLFHFRFSLSFFSFFFFSYSLFVTKSFFFSSFTCLTLFLVIICLFNYNGYVIFLRY